MRFPFRGKKTPLTICAPEEWMARWKQTVPPECRDVPITHEGETVVAFICVRQFVMMLQDGLLMERTFFDVCSFFQRAGYHVIWLMRCAQDIHNGYLKLQSASPDGARCKWLWKSPTTNFGRWTSDNFNATILLQHRAEPTAELADCRERILQRVTWAESDEETQMVPPKTRFMTVDTPGSPVELLAWLNGASLNHVRRLVGE